MRTIKASGHAMWLRSKVVKHTSFFVCVLPSRSKESRLKMRSQSCLLFYLVVFLTALHVDKSLSLESSSSLSSPYDSASSSSSSDTSAMPGSQRQVTQTGATVDLLSVNITPPKLSKPHPKAKILSKTEISDLKKFRKRVRNTIYAREKRLTNPTYAAEAAYRFRERRKQDPERLAKYRAYRRAYKQRVKMNQNHLKPSIISSTDKRKAEDVAKDSNNGKKRVRSNTSFVQPKNPADSQPEPHSSRPVTAEQTLNAKSRNVLRIKLSPEVLKRYKDSLL